MKNLTPDSIENRDSTETVGCNRRFRLRSRTRRLQVSLERNSAGDSNHILKEPDSGRGQHPFRHGRNSLHVIQQVLSQSDICQLFVRVDGTVEHPLGRNNPVALSGNGHHVLDYFAPESHGCIQIILQTALLDNRMHFATLKASLEAGRRADWVEVGAVRLDAGRRQSLILLTWRSIDKEMPASKAAVEMMDRERRQMAQDIHDNLCQELLSLAFAAGKLSRELLECKLDQTAAQAIALTSALQRVLGQTRATARGIVNPPTRGDGLVSGLRRLADDISARFGIECVFSGHYCPSLSSEEECQLYRIAQEAIANALRHGQASSIHLNLERCPTGLCFYIKDNGMGFQVSGNWSQSGIGLGGMAHRARHIGATLSIESQPDRGTLVICQLPSSHR